MNSEELIKLINDVTFEVEGKQKISCAKIFQLSEKYSVSLKEIGKCCDENKIKIANCQIGCFE